MIPFNVSTVIASYYELNVSDDLVKTIPFGHSRHFPLSFNVSDKKIISGELNFFNSNLYKNFDITHLIPEKNYKIELHKTKESVVILNLLDNCFGHALLKLFYSIKYIKEHESNFDFVLIVPNALKHFIIEKQGVNLITVDLKFSELEKCYVLNDAIEKVAKLYKEVFIDAAETYCEFDFNELKSNLNFCNKEIILEFKNKITFYYRSDYWRKWQGSAQLKNCINLFTLLKPFFSEQAEFCVVGDKDKCKFPLWIKDYRITAFSPGVDFQYNQIFQSSLICIGLTGSHMLFPSLFASCTVHLHPSFKYKNMAEDIVVNEKSQEMLSAYKHLYYYGNDNCSDITPKKLGDLMLSHFVGLIEKEYKINTSIDSQKEWIEKNYSIVNYNLIQENRKLFNKSENKKKFRKYYFDKIFNLITSN